MGKLSAPRPAAIDADQDAAGYEQDHVHEVYQRIASHFSATRYKPWPLVSSFLATLPPGSIGADLGCGNGKYLHLRSVVHPRHDADPSRGIITHGLDRSANLVDLAATNSPLNTSNTTPVQGNPGARNEVCVGDALQSGYRSHSLDFAMSIATIHHFATEQRRIEAVLELIRIVKPVPPTTSNADTPANSSSSNASGLPSESTSNATGSGSGRFMIYVWALEQRGQSRRDFEAVATVQNGPKEGLDGAPASPSPSRSAAPAVVGDDGQANAKETRTTSGTGEQDLLVPWVTPASGLTTGSSKRADKGKSKDMKDGAQADAKASKMTPSEADPAPSHSPKVYQRFYHVFRHGELESIVERAAQLYRERSMAARRSSQVSARSESTSTSTPAQGKEASNAGLPLVNVVLQGSGWERGNWWGVWRVERVEQAPPIDRATVGGGGVTFTSTI